jgi:hypothetical protein
MKPYLRVATVTLLAYLLTSCTSDLEEVWIEPDGAGRVSYHTDLSGIYPFLLLSIQAQLEKDPDSLDESDRQLIAFFNREQLDTTILFADIFAEAMEDAPGDGIGDLFRNIDNDSSLNADQKDLIKGILGDLATMEFNINANRDAGDLAVRSTQFFTELSDYASFGSELSEVIELVAAESDSLDAGEAQLAAQAIGGMFGGSTRYQLDGNTLRVFRPADVPFNEQDNLDSDINRAMAMAMFSSSDEDYEILLHLPGKIRSVSYPDAEINKRERTVRVRIPAEQLDEDVEFSIVFKSKRRR